MKKVLSIYTLGFIAGLMTAGYVSMWKELKTYDTEAKATKKSVDRIIQENINRHMTDFSEKQKQILKDMGYNVW